MLTSGPGLDTATAVTVAMPTSILTANGKDFQADQREPVARSRQSIADLAKATEQINRDRAELAAKPMPRGSALMELFRVKHPETVLTEDEQKKAGRALRCTGCDAVVMPSCGCTNAPFVRAGPQFFANQPELLKQLKPVKPNGHDVTEAAADVTKVADATNVTPEGDEFRPMTAAERMRRMRSKRAAEQTGGGGLIDELFPKDSPACDIDWEAQEPGADAKQHARAARWQLLEAERLAVEFAMLREGVRPGDIKKDRHVKAVRKVARHWTELAEKLERMRRP